MQKRIGLVLEGGGGKGAYQIGVWKAIRELGIEKYIVAVSGTSAGALNAALICKGNLGAAEHVWQDIDMNVVLGQKVKDDYLNGDCFFTQRSLKKVIDVALQGNEKQTNIKDCYIACKYVNKQAVRYFNILNFYDIELKKRVLLASSAIPIVFENVEIDGDMFMDGGANGDNTPIKPLLELKLDKIIIIHLSKNNIQYVKKSNYKTQIYEVIPSQDLGGFLTGTLDFEPDNIVQRKALGYKDGIVQLMELAEELFKDNFSVEIDIKINKERCKKEKVSNNTKKEQNKMEAFKFKNEAIQKEYEKNYQNLQSLANSQVKNTEYLWDETVNRQAITIEKVKKILQSEGLNSHITSKVFKNIEIFLRRCRNAEFHIALVGAIKAGKSTLINAILGYEYASTKITPETAALTKFRKAAKNYVKVSFYSVDEWDKLYQSAVDSKASVFLEEYDELNADAEKNKLLGINERTFECTSVDALVSEIYKWTSSKSSAHYFVKEVEVGLEGFNLPEGVVLVDTPGLDDVIEYRSNITRDYIDRANAVLVCIKSDALTGQEMATIYSVFANTRYNPEKVYIIATQQDKLNRPIQNWVEQQEEWLKYLKGKSAYASVELAKKNLVPVSAYLYTLLKEYNNLSEDDEKYWDLDSALSKLRIKNINEHYQELLDFTNIELLKNKINREIVSNYKKLLIEDITCTYGLCKDEINEIMVRVRASQEEIVKISLGSIEDIKKKSDEYSRKYTEVLEDKKELEILLKKLQVATRQRADELERSIKSLGGR